MGPLCGRSSLIASDMISHISLPLTDLPLLLPGGRRLCLLSVSSKSFTEAVKGPAVNKDLCLSSYSGPVGCASKGSENRPVPEIVSECFCPILVHFFQSTPRELGRVGEVLVPING